MMSKSKYKLFLRAGARPNFMKIAPLMKAFADQAAVVLRGIDGARDVKVEQVAGMVEVAVELDRRAMARWGCSPRMRAP